MGVEDLEVELERQVQESKQGQQAETGLGEGALILCRCVSGLLPSRPHPGGCPVWRARARMSGSRVLG